MIYLAVLALKIPVLPSLLELAPRKWTEFTIDGVQFTVFAKRVSS